MADKIEYAIIAVLLCLSLLLGSVSIYGAVKCNEAGGIWLAHSYACVKANRINLSGE